MPREAGVCHDLDLLHRNMTGGLMYIRRLRAVYGRQQRSGTITATSLRNQCASLVFGTAHKMRALQSRHDATAALVSIKTPFGCAHRFPLVVPERVTCVPRC